MTIDWTDPRVEGDQVLCDCGRRPAVMITVSVSGPAVVPRLSPRGMGGVGMTLAGCVEHVDVALTAAHAFIDDVTGR